MNSDIDQVVPHEIPTRPWQIDGHDHLIVADYYSKFPIVRKIPMGQCNSQTVVNLTKQMFSEHGVPQRVVSDNGPQYEVRRNGILTT